MSELTPQVLSGRIAFIVALSGALLTWFFIDQAPPMQFLLPFGFFMALFIISFVAIRYTMSRYIQDKLSLIYQTIHQLKRNKEEGAEAQASSTDSINQVQEEVVDWYLDNKKEIDRLTVLEQYRREFIGNVSHELKTPVFNIQGYLLTLLEGGLEDETINRKYLERAEKSVEKLIKLLNELDMIIRLDTGGIQLNIKKVDIVAIINEVIESIEFKADKKNIKLKVKRKHSEPLWVMADEDKIAQVITNLIINSIKYGKEKGQTTISFHNIKDQILIEVKDDGIGIQENEMSRIFDRFYRSDQARGRDNKGFGLGLSIVKHIIEAHGETIHVNSTPNEGSVFSFTLKKAGRK